jgi:putative cell wall-binding protein
MRFKSRSRALATSALAASLGLAGLGLVAPAAQAAPAETDRVAGADRYETAADIAEASYPAADTVVLTTGQKLPDALSANPIAGATDAPILLTLTDSIPASTQAALEGINPTNVIIVGGTAAVSADVEAALEDDGYTVTREAGTDRFKTAAEVAREVGTAPQIDADGAGEQQAQATVALANGLTGLPDAVAASPMLHQMDIPLLLTGPDTLNEDAAAAMEALNAEQVLILGGTAAISLNIEQELQADGINAERLAGNDRWGTATAIADFELDFLGFEATTTYIASGFSLADALAGGPLASQTNSPIVLVSETNVPAPTSTFLEEHAAEIERIVALGGTAVINDSVLTKAAEHADSGTNVTLDATSVEQGGVLTGTLTGEFASAEIAGDCVEGTPVTVNSTDDTDTSTEGVQFEVNIAQDATAGDCELTVTFSDADGNVIDTVTTTVTVTERVGVTTRPELVSAQTVDTVSEGEQTPTNPLGTTVQYTFDESISNEGGLAPRAQNFLVYDADGTLADVDGGDAVVSVSGNTVTVRFDAVTTDADAATLTLATVDVNAVTDAQGETNPEGDAALGTSGGGTTTLAAGITSAPDLVTVGNFRQGANTGETAVDFTFDEDAFVVDPAGFSLILLDGTDLVCAGPAVGSETTSGGTTAGGNGTTTITVICEAAGDQVLTANDVARGTVLANTVSDTAGVDGNGNPLQAAEVSNSGNTIEPDLVNVELRPGATADDVDQALFTFDQTVTVLTPTNFNLYDVSSVESPSTAAEVNPNDATQVLVTFGTTAADSAVGGNVEDGAVNSTTSPALANEQDEEGVANTATTSGQTPGRTDAPDLVSVSLSQTTTTDAFGNVTTGDFEATYTFDEDVTVTTVTDFKLYLSDGTMLVASACALTAPTGDQVQEDVDNSVTCTAYTNATSDQVGSAVLGTVDDGAVTEEGGTLTNPEGAEFTSGGTGTPQQ